MWRPVHVLLATRQSAKSGRSEQSDSHSKTSTSTSASTSASTSRPHTRYNRGFSRGMLFLLVHKSAAVCSTAGMSSRGVMVRDVVSTSARERRRCWSLGGEEGRGRYPWALEPLRTRTTTYRQHYYGHYDHYLIVRVGVGGVGT